MTQANTVQLAIADGLANGNYPGQMAKVLSLKWHQNLPIILDGVYPEEAEDMEFIVEAALREGQREL